MPNSPPPFCKNTIHTSQLLTIFLMKPTKPCLMKFLRQPQLLKFFCPTDKFVEKFLISVVHVELAPTTDLFVILNHSFATYRIVQYVLQLHNNDIHTLTSYTRHKNDLLISLSLNYLLNSPTPVNFFFFLFHIFHIFIFVTNFFPKTFRPL